MLHTYRFAFRGRNRYVDADTIFSAMVKFQTLHEGSHLDTLDELVVTKLK